MALTRKLLKGMGLSEEQIDSVIDAHTETVDGLKSQIESMKADAGKLKDVQKELDDLKKGKDWKAEHDKVKKEFDDFKASTSAKEAENAKREAVREAAKKAGLSEAGIAKAVKYADLTKIELDDEGKVKDADKLVSGIKDEWGDYVTTTRTQGQKVETPPRNDGATMTKEDIYAKDDKGRYKMSTAERQKALAEHPELMTA